MNSIKDLTEQQIIKICETILNFKEDNIESINPSMLEDYITVLGYFKDGDIVSYGFSLTGIEGDNITDKQQAEYFKFINRINVFSVDSELMIGNDNGVIEWVTVYRNEIPTWEQLKEDKDGFYVLDQSNEKYYIFTK